MYCGDETGSFIGEIGSHVSRFGYGGEDSPKYVVPSLCFESDNAETSNLHVSTSCYRRKGTNYRTPLRSVQVPSDLSEQPIVDPASFLQQGDSIEDWDAYETLWQSAFDSLHVTDQFKHTKGGGNYKQNSAASGVTSGTVQATQISDGKCVHPLLIVSPGCTHRVGSTAYDQAAHRKEMSQLTELVMEKLCAKAMFVAPAPMLAAFAHGRQTALVVDIGASGCRATPIVDGLVMKQAQRRNGRGGDWLGNVQWQALLKEKAGVVRPRYLVNNASDKNTSTGRGIFHRWAMQDLMYEFRTSGNVSLAHWWYDPTVPFLYKDEEKKKKKTGSDDEDNEDDGSDGSSSDGDNNGQANNLLTTSSGNGSAIYELPDGTLVDLTTRIGKDLCRIPELLFSEELPFLTEDYGQKHPNAADVYNEHPSLTNLPLPQLIHNSLSAVADVDARKELATSILLTGGSSRFVNMEQRLSLEMPRITSSAFKCKVTASHNAIERSCAPWIGGSILSSLGSFQQLWLSRTEYEEYGTTLAVQRFP